MVYFSATQGMGRSPTARYFGLTSAAEALAYWQHPLLGKRLTECTRLMLSIPGKTAHEVLSSPDDLKLRSCLTLFAAVAPQEPVFPQALQRYYGAKPDSRTLALLEQTG